MQQRDAQVRKTAAGGRKTPSPTLVQRAIHSAARVWRPAGSVLAVVLALLLTWHVINGKHGLSVWQQKRGEDKRLRKEIDSLEQENARLRERVEKLKTDPHSIEREAREKLHYAKPGEVIYTLPGAPSTRQPAAK